MSPSRAFMHFTMLIFYSFSYIGCNLHPPVLNPSITTPAKTLGDCQACKLLVESFKKGLERTARGKFEGGDAAWEEEKLKSYRRSEVRLVELQEGLCKDVKEYDVQCHSLAEKSEEYIEDWWFNHHESEDIYEFLCIEKLKYCCPPRHFGKECRPCLTDPQKPCSGNGKCKGDGTRKGNGLCACEKGYGGEKCEVCSSGYYQAYRDSEKLLCSPCHRACVGECSQSGPKGCVVCASGWSMDAEEGCVDVNECETAGKCSRNQFCVNQEGSHACLVCDKACDGCHGDGPDLCNSCAQGYSRKGELCVADRDEDTHTDHLTSTRYMTYIGLLVATAILLPRSRTLGGAVAALVVSYIVGAEYYCMLNGHSHGILDLNSIDLSQLFRSPSSAPVH